MCEYVTHVQCIREVFISSWSSASHEETMATHWDFKEFLSEELVAFEAGHMCEEVFGPRRSSWFLCSNVCCKKTNGHSTVLFWVTVLKNAGQTPQISGRGWEHDPELMISGAGCELILNVETGLAAWCRPASSTSPSSRAVFAQSTAPTARDAFSFVSFQCFMRQNPFAVGRSLCQGRAAPGRASLWAVSLVPQDVGAPSCFRGGCCWSDPTQPWQGFRGLHRPCSSLLDSGIVGCCFNPVEQSVYWQQGHGGSQS